MSGAVSPSAPAWGTYRRLWPYVRPYRARLALVLGVSLLSTLLSLVQPYLSKLMIDDGLMARDMRVLATIAGVMFALTILGFGLGLASSYRYASLSAAMLFDMRASLLRHLQRLSPRFYGGFRLGDLLSRLNGDVGDVQRIAADSLLAVLGNVLLFVGCVVAMLALSWRLFLVSIVLVPACVASFAWCQRRLTRHARAMKERGADVGSLLVDTVLGMRVVASLGAEAHEARRFRERNDGFVAAMLRMQLASFAAGALPGTIMTAATSAVVLCGGWLIIHDRMTIGTLVAFMTYHGRLLSPVQSLMGLGTALATTRVSLARIFELFDAAPEVAERPDVVPLGPVARTIRVEGVSKRYDRGAVLAGLDLEIAAGTTVAILGPSGTGKSTLADLLVRYLDPDAGRILVDGRDLRDVRLADLRREIVLVDQSPYLFNDTIAANIGFALPGVSEAEVAAAARAAGLEELIARLPEGLATRTGERGLALSAGERQRVALARALLRRPSVLILDEPSSALDEETERLVADGLRQALPDATILVITHKPALARIADRVVTIAGGRARELTREVAHA